MSAAGRERDAYPHKAIMADTMKLLGNSGYRMIITNVDRYHDVKYCTEAGEPTMINDRPFCQLDIVVDNAYATERNNRTMKYALLVGFFVFQYAKLRILQFYHDLVDRYLERFMFQYCEMDTESAYIDWGVHQRTRDIRSPRTLLPAPC